MSKLEFVGTKIPPEWIKRLEELSEETKKTRGVILREAIGQYLGLDSDNPDNKKTDPLRSEIEDLKARVTALEGETTLSNSYPVGKEITRLAMDNRVKPVAIPDQKLNQKCPHCGSTKYRLNGLGQLRADGTKGQRLKCTACGKGWVV